MVSSLNRSNVLGGRRRHGDFRFGIEEEYFLADAKTMIAAAETPDALFEQFNSGGVSLGREMLQAQLEVASKPHSTPAAARDELRSLRDAASEAAREYG